MKLFRTLGLPLLLLLAVSACSLTTVSQSWKDEQFSAALGKVLVLGVSKNATARRSFEQKLAGLLTKQGVTAVPSYSLLPGDEKLKKEQVVAVVKTSDIQTILVTRVSSVKEVKELRQDVVGSVSYGVGLQPLNYSNRHGFDRDWYGRYGRHYNEAFSATSRQYQVQWQVITTDSSLYHLGNENMVWSAILESESDGMEKTINSLAKTLVKQMEKDGVLK